MERHREDSRRPMRRDRDLCQRKSERLEWFQSWHAKATGASGHWGPHSPCREQVEGLCYLRKTNQTENPINANRPIRNNISMTSTVRSSARRVNAVQ